MEKDLYEVLGVKKDASSGDIRKAFLKAAKKYHPDVNPGNKEAEQRFKEVNLAYEVLKDDKKRAQYDQMRANPFARAGARGGPSGGASYSGGFDPDMFADLGLGDLFEEIFGGGGGGFRGRPGRGGQGGFRTMARRGGDQETALNVSFQEAARGGEKSLEFADGRRLTVKIPEGVETGSKIRLSGQGEPGTGGAPAGDLILTLTVGTHPTFKREGKDVVMTLPITFSEAVLGTELEVPTLDGKVTMKIPAGISSGQRLKLSGKGVKAGKDAARGDQLVEVSIRIPKGGDESYREAAEIAKRSDFNPRP